MVKVAEEVGSDKQELKRFLKLAVDKPIHMAFALGGDGRAIVKLDKLKLPRALDKHLKENASDAKNHRFGTVMIDPDDPKRVRFIVNKEIGGFARKLVLALKGTGFNKVHITLEDGSSLEQHEGEPEEDEDHRPTPQNALPETAPETAPTAPAQTAPAQTAPAQTAPAQTAPTPTGPAQTPAAQTATTLDPTLLDPPLLDAPTLTTQLTALVKQMMAVIAKDPSQKAGLAELATDAQVSLKRGDLEQAAAGLEILRDAIGAGVQSNGAAQPGNGAAAQPAPQPAEVQKAQKSRAAWTATRSRVDAEVQKLGKAILAASDGEDLGADLDSRFRTAVEPVLSNLDETLSDTLAQAAATQDPAERKQLMQQARDTIDSYTSFVQSSKIITDLDNNPFLQLTIGKTLTATLAALSAAIRSE